MNFLSWVKGFYPSTIPTKDVVALNEDVSEEDMELPIITMNDSIRKIEEYVSSSEPEQEPEKEIAIIEVVPELQLQEIITETVLIPVDPEILNTINSRIEETRRNMMNFHSEDAEQDWNLNEKELLEIEDNEIGDALQQAILSLFG